MVDVTLVNRGASKDDLAADDAYDAFGDVNTSVGNLETAVDTIEAAYLNKAGSVALTANWDVGSFSITALSLITDTINEEAVGAGVTIDGILIKDGLVDGIDIATDVAANTTKVTNATHTGDVTGDVALTIGALKVATGMVQANAIDLTKLADIATASFMGRNTAATGDPEVLSMTTAKTMLALALADISDSGTLAALNEVTSSEIANNFITAFTDMAAAIVAADSLLIQDSAVGSREATFTQLDTYFNSSLSFNNYVHPDHTGDVSSTADGATVIGSLKVATGMVQDDAVTYAKMQNVVNDERLLGRVSGANGVVEELTQAQVLTFLGSVGGGLVPTYKVANYTAVAGDFVIIDLGGTARTVTLPATIAANDRIAVHCFNSSATVVLLTIGRNAKTIYFRGDINGYAGGSADDITMEDGETIELIASTTANWNVV